MNAMAAMDGMPMPGGWTMSMAWMIMPGQSWLSAAASFLGMWTAMMMPMMLPSVVPQLWRYQRAIGEASTVRKSALTALAAATYFAVWIVPGAIVYPLGIAFATIAMRHAELSEAIPLLAALAVVAAGALQFTRWKAHRLACCTAGPDPSTLRVDAITALRYGCTLARHCIECCASLMAVLFVLGMMNLGVMIAVTIAITAERLAPAGGRVARVVGVGILATGLALLAAAGTA
jgi:predicted metal-binding membrane protein